MGGVSTGDTVANVERKPHRTNSREQFKICYNHSSFVFVGRATLKVRKFNKKFKFQKARSQKLKIEQIKLNNDSDICHFMFFKLFTTLLLCFRIFELLNPVSFSFM